MTTMNDTLTNILAVPATLAQGALHNLWFQSESATEAGRDTDRLFMFILWTCIISFTIVLGLAYYFAWKYRRKPGVPTQRSPSHNTPLELAWSIIPLLVMVVIFFWGFRGYMAKAVAPAGAEIIRITGRQWDWADVTYDNGRSLGPKDFARVGGKDSPVITVPAGRPVKFMLSSRDVIHSFFIPDMRIKFDVFPNRFTSFWIDPQAEGDHEIFCAEYCGQDHSEMNATLRVVSPEAYAAYKAEEVVIEDPVEFGRFLYRSKGCMACHTLDGSAGTGPTWKGLYGRTETMTSGDQVNLADDETFYNYIRESIYEPNVKIVKGYGPQMNSYAGLIDEKQLDGIIAFMKSPEISGRAAPAGGAPAGQDQGAGQGDQQQQGGGGGGH